MAYTYKTMGEMCATAKLLGFDLLVGKSGGAKLVFVMAVSSGHSFEVAEEMVVAALIVRMDLDHTDAMGKAVRAGLAPMLEEARQSMDCAVSAVSGGKVDVGDEAVGEVSATGGGVVEMASVAESVQAVCLEEAKAPFDWAEEVEVRGPSVVVSSDASDGALSVSEASSVEMPIGYGAAAVKVTLGDGGFSVHSGGASVAAVVEAVAVSEQASAAHVVGLRAALRANGVFVPKRAMADLALASHSVGCVPVAFPKGQEAVRALMRVGDAALTYEDAKVCYAEGVSVAAGQARRTRCYSNSAMAAAFMESPYFKFSVYPAGVDVGHSRVGADFVEAIAGVIAIHIVNPVGLRNFMRSLKLSTH